MPKLKTPPKSRKRGDAFPGMNIQSESEDNSGIDTAIDKQHKVRAAWVDESDGPNADSMIGLQGKKWASLGSKGYQKILEERYEAVVGVPSWAQTFQSKNEDRLLTTTGNLLVQPSQLEKETLDIQKVQDLNRQTYNEGRNVRSVIFHPTSTVGLVAGDSGVVSIFQVDGKENTKLQSIKFKNFPIACAALLPNGEEFIVGSKEQNYFFGHDLLSGQSSKFTNNRLTNISRMTSFLTTPDGKHISVLSRSGNIHLLSATTKEYVDKLHMSGDVSAVAFSANFMYSHGSEGMVYVWDMKTRTCIHKFYDDGCLQGTAIAFAPNGKLLATGSSSGIVNIYETDALLNCTSPKPLKTVYNLVTPVEALKFNSSSEILCLASSYKDNAIKLLHCPSMTIFANFPSSQTNFHKVHCLDVSPNSGFFALGNNRSEVPMFRLKYYGNY